MEMNNNSNNNPVAIASIVLSGISVLCCCSWVISILFGVAGIVLGIIALRSDNKKQGDLAIAGIVVGGVGLSMGIVIAVLQIMIFSANGEGGVNVTSPASTDSVMMIMNGICSLL